jgi:hypothetical protein
VAYDAELADRIRALTRSEPGLTERKMFGGLAFLLGGHLAIAASGQGSVPRCGDPAGERDGDARSPDGRLAVRVDSMHVAAEHELAAQSSAHRTPARCRRSDRGSTE